MEEDVKCLSERKLFLNTFNLYLPNNNNSLYYYSFTQFTQSSKSLAISSSPPPSLQIRQLIFRRLGNLLKVSEPRNSKAHVKVSSLDSKASGLFKISCFDHVLFFFLNTEFPPGIQRVLQNLCHYRVSEYIFAKLFAMKSHSNKGLSDPHTNIYSVSIFSQIHGPLYGWSVAHFKSLLKQV